MSNRIELKRSYILTELDEKRIKEKIKQENFQLVSEEVECRNLERKQMPYRDIAKKYEESKA